LSSLLSYYYPVVGVFSTTNSTKHSLFTPSETKQLSIFMQPPSVR